MNALQGQRAARPAQQGASKRPLTRLPRSAGRAARLRPCAVKVDPNVPSLQELLQSSMQQATMPAKEEPMPALPSLPSADAGASSTTQLQQNVMDRPAVTREALPTLPDPAVDVPANALPASTPTPSAADAVLSSTSSTSGPSTIEPTPPPQLDDAAAQAQDSAAVLASDVGSKASELADAANAATSQAAEAASKAASDLTGALSGAASGVTGAVTDVTSSVTSAFSGATSSVTAGASGLLSQASSLFSQAKGSVDQALGGVTSTVGSSLDQVTSTTGSATQALSTTIDGAISSARAAANAAAVAFDSTFGGAVSAANEAVSGAVDALPAPAKEALLTVSAAVGAAVGAAAAQAAEHPRAAAVVGAAVAVPAGVSWYKARYGGFAGELAPEQVLNMLYEQNAALIDIRDVEEREEEGIVEAKLAARAKVAAFPIQVSVPARIARDASNAEELRLLVNAAYMTGLPQITSSVTKVIIMDSSGSGAARKVARALVSVGQPLAYTMKGGFEGWVDAGLPVAEGASYTANPVAFLGDNVEVLAGSVGSALDSLKRPSVGVPVLGGTALGAAALYNYHTTLEYIGVLGLLATLANKASQYSSPRDALDDVVGSYQSLVRRLPGGKGRVAAGNDDLTAGALGDGAGVERWDGSSESSGAELETADK